MFEETRKSNGKEAGNDTEYIRLSLNGFMEAQYDQDKLAKLLKVSCRRLKELVSCPFGDEQVFGGTDRVWPTVLCRNLQQLSDFQMGKAFGTIWTTALMLRRWQTLPDSEFAELCSGKSPADFDNLKVELRMTEMLIRATLPADLLRGAEDSLSWAFCHLKNCFPEGSIYQTEKLVRDYFAVYGDQLTDLRRYSLEVCDLDPNPDADLILVNVDQVLANLEEQVARRDWTPSIYSSELGLTEIDKEIQKSSGLAESSRVDGWFNDYMRSGQRPGSVQYTGRLAEPSFPTTMTPKALRSLANLARSLERSCRTQPEFGSLQCSASHYELQILPGILRNVRDGFELIADIISAQ